MRDRTKEAFILSAATAKPEDIEPYARDPKFRRATTNMKLAYACLDSALKEFRSEIAEDPSSFGVILGTSHGELGSTMEFLRDWATLGTPRPIAFQNSL